MSVQERLARARAQAQAPYERRQRRNDRFRFEGRDFKYFVHPYNSTWRNERTIEVPVALDLHRGVLLEVGNVLAHYGTAGHVVVDRYEQAPDVLNIDALDYRPDTRFDTIISISTVEHMGFDEAERDPGKPRRAIEHLAGLLKPGGTMLVTLPFGYNHDAEATAAPDGGCFSQVVYMRRTSARGDWRQVAWEDLSGRPYGFPFRGANGVAFGFVHR